MSGRVSVAKARLLGTDKPRSFEGGEEKSAFAGSGALVPPYDPETLLYWHEHSSALRPNVDAMVVNIDGHGHRIEPVIDLRAKGADELVGAAIMARTFNASAGAEEPEEPSVELIEAEKARIAKRMKLERGLLESWLRHAAHEGSFTRLRCRLRSDLEITGNGYAEVLRNRNGRGKISRFRYVPAYLCRLLPLGPEFVEVPELEQLSPIHYEETAVDRRLRRYVQLDEVTGNYIYFKELGDPRTLSLKTGLFYDSEEELYEAEGERAIRATEMIHFRIDSANSPYGVPRWVAAIPEVQGKRAAAEVNYFLFDNKSVPPLAIFVSGGKLAEGADEKIEKFITEEIRGRENWSKILLIEAESGSSGTAPKIEIHRLSKEITEDGLFLRYDARCAQTIGSQWRIPRILRGDTDDFNRATAEAALQMAEDLVFAPERNEFDQWMNSKVLPWLGIFCLRFVSLTPSTRNPERLAQNIERLSKVGGLTPRDARDLAGDVFNREFAPIPAPWQDVPVAFTLGGIQTGQGGASIEESAEKILDLRERLEARAGSLAESRARLVRESQGGELTIELTPELLDQLVERGS